MNNKLKIIFCSIFAALLLWLCVVGTIIAIPKKDTNTTEPQFVTVNKIDFYDVSSNNEVIKNIQSSFCIKIGEQVKIEQAEFDKLKEQALTIETETTLVGYRPDVWNQLRNDGKLPISAEETIGKYYLSSGVHNYGYYKAEIVNFTVKRVSVKNDTNGTYIVKVQTETNDFVQDRIIQTFSYETFVIPNNKICKITFFEN